MIGIINITSLIEIFNSILRSRPSKMAQYSKKLKSLIFKFQITNYFYPFVMVISITVIFSVLFLTPSFGSKPHETPSGSWNCKITLQPYWSLKRYSTYSNSTPYLHILLEIVTRYLYQTVNHTLLIEKLKFTK